MNIVSLQNKIHKRVVNKKTRSDYDDIGNLIKQKRKELNVTQDYIAKGICSISYLSKIENNQILPNEFYIKEIMNRLEVEEEVIEQSIHDNEYLKKLVHFHYFGKMDEIEQLQHTIAKVQKNLTIQIIKLGCTIISDDYRSNTMIQSLEHHIANMNDFELKCYLFFCIFHFVKKRQFKTCLSVIRNYHKIEEKNDYLDGIVAFNEYIVCQELHIFNSSKKSYQYAKEIAIRVSNYHLVRNLEIERIYYLSRENPMLALTQIDLMLQLDLDESQFERLVWIKSWCLYEVNRNQEATMLLKQVAENSVYHLDKLCLLYLICYKEQDFDVMESVYNLIQFEEKEYTKRPLFFQVQLTRLKEEHERKEYLKDVVIPICMKRNDFYYMQKYTDQLITICTSTSRYKEAIQHYHRFEKEKGKVLKIYNSIY